MGLTQYLRQEWKKPDMKVLRERMVTWRASEAVVRVPKPLRLDRARSLGYKAKKGVIVVRVRVIRGGHKRMRPKKGRTTKRMHIRKNLKMNYRTIAENRASRKYTNMEVLNSYLIGKDGIHYFFEVILIDRVAPEILSDKDLGPVVIGHKNRNLRGLTSSGRKSRGLRNPATKKPKIYPNIHNSY